MLKRKLSTPATAEVERRPRAVGDAATGLCHDDGAGGMIPYFLAVVSRRETQEQARVAPCQRAWWSHADAEVASWHVGSKSGTETQDQLSHQPPSYRRVRFGPRNT